MAQAGNYSYIKGPSEFRYGEDFDIFWERFQAFVGAAKCAKESQFSLFLSYLDDVSFRRVKAITFAAEHMGEDDIVDFSKAHGPIKAALSKESDIPERITLKYIVQNPSESVSQFGDNIRFIGQKVFAEGTDRNALVIESFCAGLRDTTLASKMLQRSFDTLSEAVKFAMSRKEVTNIKSVLIEQRRGGSTKDISVLTTDVNAATPQANTTSVSNQPRTRSTFRCYSCNKEGHYKRDCPNKLPQNDVCHYCKKSGHWKRDCFKWLRENNHTRGSVQNGRYIRGQYNQGGYNSWRGDYSAHTNEGNPNTNTRGAHRGLSNFRARPGTPIAGRGRARTAWPPM